MFRRIYVHNFRCFENFDLKLNGQSSVLILGKNGTGKSTLGSALRLLQNIAKGTNRVRQFLKLSDFANHRTDVPIRFEITVELQGRIYDYSLSFELPEGFKEARVKDETLGVDGEIIYTRQEAQVMLASPETRFLVDWHLVALPVIQTRGLDNPIEKFRAWISRLVLIAPVPALITGESNEDSLYPDKQVKNFADWFNGVLGAYPASYSTIDAFLKQVIPDFLDFQNKEIGETARKIIVRFGIEERILPIDFERLSDGEKVFFVCAVLVAANRHYGPIFCLWDEPDNFVSLSEVGHMIVALHKSFSQSGQLFVTSHNPEAIRKFSDENTVCLARKSHLEPTTAQWLSDVNYQGDLIDSLIQGEFVSGG